MIVNSKIKKNFQNNFGKDQKSSSWFHSLLCYCLYYLRKYPIHVTGGQGKTPNTRCIPWESKKNYHKQFTTVTAHKNVQKLLQWKMYI